MQQISVLVEWDTDVNQWVCMARVRSGGWDVSSSPVKVVLEEDKLYYIHLDVPENTPRTLRPKSHCRDPGPAAWPKYPRCC